ncbi:MAG: hypothetical protein ABWW69_03140 [Pyrodictiaceae archaeon]
MKSLFDIVECRIKVTLEDLAVFLAFHQTVPGTSPPIFSYNGRLYVPVGVSLQQACLLEAEAGDEASKKYLHIKASREGVSYEFSDKPPETMDVKVYPILHVIREG